MSGDSDNVFARWSRRKLTVQDSERQASPLPEQAGEDATKEAEQAPQDAAAGAEALPPAVPLPRLEDITAETDLSAFLQEGVPETLKRAALRKSWSLDQTIRDYIGPSENAWDFNAPGAIPGFGPLEAGKAVAEFLSKIGDETAGPTEASAAEASPVAPEASPAVPDDVVGPEAPTEQASAEAAPAPQEAPDSPDLARDRAEAASSEEEAPTVRFAVRPRHGGAVPR
jgi:hypothetical protein